VSDKADNTGESYSKERRRFLLRAVQTGGLALVACLAYRWLYDPHGPQSLSRARQQLDKLPDWSVAREGASMAIVKGDNRHKTLDAAVEALGGISRFVKKGDRVLLKVNAAFATPPDLGATTHPDLVEAMVKLCLAAGASEVFVADNPINDAQTCFRLTGIGAAAEKAGARVIMPTSRSFVPFTLENGALIRHWPLFYEPLARATKVIGLAPVKHHNRSGASMTMKNWYGLLGGRRNIFHQDINTIITELACMVRPTLVVLDGTVVMMTNGPTGGSLSDLVPAHTLIVSTDMVAADSFGATLLGRRVEDLPYLSMGEKAGCGTTNFESLGQKRLEVASA
jgi:uncharacterized protein (DUF362 family)